MKLRLVDLDSSLLEQAPFWDNGDAMEVLNCDELGPEVRLWASRRGMRKFSALLPASRPGDHPVATFLGSGDYHHLTTALVARLAGPLTVIHFDNHPDWALLPPAYHCGSLVNRLLELPQVARVVTVGPCSADLALPQVSCGNLGALKCGRVEIYPWRRPPARVMAGIGSGHGFSQAGSRLHWRNLEDEDWDGFWDELLDRLPTRRVYVTVDKDVLHPGHALTNWDQGGLDLDRLVAAVRRIAARTEVVGADVVGDHSPRRFSGLLKRISARLELSPPDPTLEQRAAVNGAANRALWTALKDIR